MQGNKLSLPHEDDYKPRRTQSTKSINQQTKRATKNKQAINNNRITAPVWWKLFYYCYVPTPLISKFLGRHESHRPRERIRNITRVFLSDRLNLLISEFGNKYDIMTLNIYLWITITQSFHRHVTELGDVSLCLPQTYTTLCLELDLF